MRLLVHPVDSQGFAQVSGSSRIASGPEALEPREDVPPGRVVGLHPIAPVTLPIAQLARPRPVRHVGPVEREILRRPDHRLQFDQRAVRECAA